MYKNNVWPTYMGLFIVCSPHHGSVVGDQTLKLVNCHERWVFKSTAIGNMSAHSIALYNCSGYTVYKIDQNTFSPDITSQHRKDVNGH